MGLAKGFLRLPAPGTLLKPAALPRKLPPTHPSRHLHPTRSTTPLSALRTLARRLFSTTPSAGRAPTPPAPADLATRVRIHSRPTFHPAAQQARRFGPGGLGRGPMGPGVRTGFAAGRSVASVGLGSARGYASSAQPLFSNLVSNAPLLLRAGVDELKDQVTDLKKQRRARPSHVAKADKGKKRSSVAKSLIQPSSIRGPAAGPSAPKAAAAAAANSTSAVAAEEADFHTFFGPSPTHAIPAARSPWAKTTLEVALVPDLRDTLPATSLSHLAALHRSTYDLHRRRLDGLLHALEQKGAWLDDDVSVVAEDDRVRVIFDGRAKVEVRAILGDRKGEDDWFVLRESRKSAEPPAADLLASLVFPLMSASVSFPSAALAVPADLVSPATTTPSSLDSGLTTPSSRVAFSIAPTMDDDFLSSSMDDDLSSVGFSSAFLSDLSVSSAGRQGFSVVDLSAEVGFDEDWSDA